MKIFKSPAKNYLYFFYRLLNPIFDPLKLYTGITGYLWFFRDIFKYKLRDPSARIFNLNLYPVVDGKISFTPFDAHYYYQQLWVFEHVLKNKPRSHIDVASTYQMSGYLSKIVKTTFIDLRPIESQLKNLTVKRGDMLHMPYKDNSVMSLSCLHSIEHVGLGRYGDALDPEGTKKACVELARVLAKKGRLYISTPVGKERLCFNAHRIFDPKTIINYFKNLKLLNFSVVDDEGLFHQDVQTTKYKSLNYGCGMFEFTKL